MNILLSPNYYLPMRSGVPHISRHLASSLVSKGHNVVIVTPRWEQSSPSFEMIDGIEVHRMPFGFPWRFLWQNPYEGFLQFFLRLPVDLQRLLRIIVRNQIEVINIHCPNGPHFPYIIFSQLLSKRPLVITLHGAEFVRWNSPDSRARRTLLPYGLRRAEQITVVSSQLSSEVSRLCPEASDKIVIIPNGVTIDGLGGTEGFPSQSPYVLSAGRLNPLKGNDVLLSAFKKVAEHDKRTHLFIAGDGSERIRLRAIALSLGLIDRVTFLGFVEPEKIQKLLYGCEFFVHSSWVEGLPMVALEAMASGKAFVGTHVGELPQVVLNAESGLLVPPGDPCALGDAMLFLLQNPGQCKAMGKRGKAFVETHFNIDEITDRYLEVYRKVIA